MAEYAVKSVAQWFIRGIMLMLKNNILGTEFFCYIGLDRPF
jgi:hypothetical protein